MASALLESLQDWTYGGTAGRYAAEVRRSLTSTQGRALSDALARLTDATPVQKRMTELAWLVEWKGLAPGSMDSRDAYMHDNLPTIRGMSVADRACNPLLGTCDGAVAHGRERGRTTAVRISPRLAALVDRFLSPAQKESFDERAMWIGARRPDLEPAVVNDVLSIWIVDFVLRRSPRPESSVRDMLTALRTDIGRSDETARKLVATGALGPNPLASRGGWW